MLYQAQGIWLSSSRYLVAELMPGNHFWQTLSRMRKMLFAEARADKRDFPPFGPIPRAFQPPILEGVNGW
jgi:hypothetical protein